jgi:hypothetical protein
MQCVFGVVTGKKSSGTVPQSQVAKVVGLGDSQKEIGHKVSYHDKYLFVTNNFSSRRRGDWRMPRNVRICLAEQSC